MAVAVSTTNSIKKAYIPLGADYDGAYAEVMTVMGSTPASEDRILDGITFIVGDYTSEVSFNTGVSILIQNGVNDGLYLNSEILTTIDCTVEVYESPTFSAAGSTLTPRNLNRISTKVLGATITKNPTVSVNGTQIGPTILNQAEIKKPLLESMIVLKASTNYLIKVTNISSYLGIINILMQINQPNL